MAAKKKQQTHAKRARELAVKERRERKRARKAERRAAADGTSTPEGGDAPGAEEQADTEAREWIR